MYSPMFCCRGALFQGHPFGNASATLDLRLLKFFTVKPHGKLDLVVEAFNVLNRTNVTELNSVYGLGPSPLTSFGRAIEAASARHIQFSLDFEF